MKSCLNRVILEALGTLLKPQKSLNSFEYLRKIIKSVSVGIEGIRLQVWHKVYLKQV